MSIMLEGRMLSIDICEHKSLKGLECLLNSITTLALPIARHSFKSLLA